MDPASSQGFLKVEGSEEKGQLEEDVTVEENQRDATLLALKMEKWAESRGVWKVSRS